jgi:hypothetical protein
LGERLAGSQKVTGSNPVGSMGLPARKSAHNQSVEGARADLAVTGAGILGLAVAVEFLRRRPGLDVVVLDKLIVAVDTLRSQSLSTSPTA